VEIGSVEVGFSWLPMILSTAMQLPFLFDISNLLQIIPILPQISELRRVYFLQSSPLMLHNLYDRTNSVFPVHGRFLVISNSFFLYLNSMYRVSRTLLHTERVLVGPLSALYHLKWYGILHQFLHYEIHLSVLTGHSGYPTVSARSLVDDKRLSKIQVHIGVDPA